jgi:shikimate kinase
MTGAADLLEARGPGLALIGLRRAGKSTVGRALATRHATPFVDLDALIAARTGRTAGEWIRERGPEAFRQAEADALAAAAEDETALIATGGGTPLREENRLRLHRHGTILYLRADPWILARRAAEGERDERPVIGDGTLADEPFRLFVERDDLYRDFCDAVIDAGRPVEEVVATCLALVGKRREGTAMGVATKRRPPA